MKKVLSAVMVIFMMLGMFGIAASAESAPSQNEPITVFVTVSDSDGKIVLAQEKITVRDQNADGVFNMDEALYAAHEAKYDGGAAAGYASSESQYGLSLVKLWGDTSGAFGYCINNASAMSLSDPVKDGDYIHAYVYQDQATWSDSYAWFDQSRLSVKEGECVTLMLSSSGYDANWNVITSPVEGATITLDGVATSYKTDAEGKVTITMENAGDFVISAKHEDKTLVPPVCKVAVDEKTPAQSEENASSEQTEQNSEKETNNAMVIVIGIIALTVIGVGIAVVVIKKKKG